MEYLHRGKRMAQEALRKDADSQKVDRPLKKLTFSEFVMPAETDSIPLETISFSSDDEHIPLSLNIIDKEVSFNSLMEIANRYGSPALEEEDLFSIISTKIENSQQDIISESLINNTVDILTGFAKPFNNHNEMVDFNVQIPYNNETRIEEEIGINVQETSSSDNDTNIANIEDSFNDNPLIEHSSEDSKNVEQENVPMKDIRSIPKTKMAKRLSRNDRIARERLKHPMIDITCKCKNDCYNVITKSDREMIHSDFWKLDYNERKSFIFYMVTRSEVKRPRKLTRGVRERKHSYQYRLRKSDDVLIPVCQSFFLSTLGFNDHQVIQTAMKRCGNATPDSDKRGKAGAVNKLSKETEESIIAHVMSFDPQVSHYRRAHAPNRLYLPPSLTIAKMHSMFLETDNIDVTYEMYRRKVRQMNISFVKLGEEECETCIKHELHSCAAADQVVPMDEPLTKDCHGCAIFQKHKVKAEKARSLYKADAKGNTLNNKFSVDLQKVIMLPRMPGIKTVIFTKRITAYNETFAPLGTKKDLKKKDAPYAMTWHEGIFKRDADDIASVFIKWLMHYDIRDKTHIVLWLDNCTAQGKNWYLFTALVAFLNSNVTKIESLILRYFEKGHTFMSADSYHHLVEKALKEMKHIYNFDDWMAALNKSGCAVTVEAGDSFRFPKGISSGKWAHNRPLIENIVEAMFTKGTTILYWKEDFENDYHQEVEFLQKKISTKIKTQKWPIFDLKYKDGPRGISDAKKKSIVDKLCPLMPEKSKYFWRNIETNNFSDSHSESDD